MWGNIKMNDEYIYCKHYYDESDEFMHCPGTKSADEKIVHDKICEKCLYYLRHSIALQVFDYIRSINNGND